MSDGMIDINTTHITCDDCGERYHRGLKFCPVCFAWPGRKDPFWICPKCEVEMYRSDKDGHKCDTKVDEPHSIKGDDFHDLTDINARLLVSHIQMKRWAEDCKVAANTITILREENKQLRENK